MGILLEAQGKVITLTTDPLLPAEVVQAEGDQCGSMWKSVLPEDTA